MEKNFQLNKYFPNLIDVRITDFVMISIGEKVENPKYLKNSLKKVKLV